MLSLETERLHLRPFTPGDAEALYREIYSDLEVLAFYNGGKVFTLEEVQGFLHKRLGGHQFGYWAVTRKEDEAFLGQVHLDAYVNAGWYELPEDSELSPFHTLEVHLGFAFGRRFWGNGYATEACRCVVRYAFTHLHLKRLVGGADAKNLPWLRLHERLGYQLYPSSDGTGMSAVLENPLTAYTFRAYREEDRAAASALGTPVIDWWYKNGADASLHRVAVCDATSEIVGHLQVVDRGVPEPSRRPGECHITLDVAPAHRGHGIGGTLYEMVEVFARRRSSRSLYTAYNEIESSIISTGQSEVAEAPAARFLASRGFVPLERFYPSFLDLDAFEPQRFQSAIDRVRSQGIRLQTYAEAGDSLENRRKLYDLEQHARAIQPFREVEPYNPEPFEAWEQEFVKRDPTTIYLAVVVDDTAETQQAWVGVVTALEWYFTGVHPPWQGRGIATALKVECITEAQKRGLGRMETENHGDNAAMLAINRKLGFVFTAPEVACVKRL